MDCHYIPTLLTPVALLFRFLRSRGGGGEKKKIRETRFVQDVGCFVGEFRTKLVSSFHNKL